MLTHLQNWSRVNGFIPHDLYNWSSELLDFNRDDIIFLNRCKVYHFTFRHIIFCFSTHLSKMLGVFRWTDSLFHVLTVILIKPFHCGTLWADTCLRSWASDKKFLFFLLGMCNWRWIWVLRRRGLGSKSQRKNLKLESKGSRRFRRHLGTFGEWHEW